MSMKFLDYAGLTYVFTKVKAMIASAVSGKADSDHTHDQSDITGLADVLSGSAATDLSNVENAVLAQKVVEAGMEGPIVNAESTDGVAYTATVDGVTELYDGLKIRILPQVVSASTSPTLNVNGLGAIRIAILSSFNNAAVVPAPIATWLSAMRPLTVTFHQMRSSATGNVTMQYWIVDWRRPSASSLYGQVPVENGGWYISGDTTDEDKAEALEALKTIGVEASGTAATLINRTTAVNAADTNYTTLMARGSSLNSAETTPAVNGAIAWTYK